MRTCGDCTLCCFEMAVEEIDKPMCATCPSVTKGGCGIYQTRPESCRTFECMWLEEPPYGLPHLLSEEERPDKCGVMFHAAGDEFMKETGIPMLAARGDFAKGAATLQKIASIGIVLYLVHADGRRQFMGHEEGLAIAKKYKFQEFSKGGPGK